MHRSVPFALAVALVAGLLAGGAPAVAAPADAVPVPGRLDLRLPDGRAAEQCADPDIARDATGWTLFCTSDAIDADERTASGDPVIHLLPVFRSADLVHWTYSGDALAKRPAWVKAGAGLWAPELQHRAGRWFLYFAAEDTTVKGGGSAIGVATSSSLAGPWKAAGTPVVAPAAKPTDPANRRATIDPEVIGFRGAHWLYFGSYAGGVFVRRLTADGLRSVPASERRITIANRYEGTNVVRHGGWWYLLASATNCCNEALTGYSVFAARARTPFGPFRDADGRSVLAARVGGTPVLSQNGNRWVGPGHESVFTAGGRDWMVYHAVDRTDPVVAGTDDYTERPALVDAVTWRHGWPEVVGGPSDGGTPPTVPQPGARIAALSDDFSGSTLGPQWSWVREPAAGTVRVSGGALRWATQAADIHPPTTPLAAVLTEQAPDGGWTATARLRTTVPDSRDDANFAQGGLIVYRGAGHYVKLAVSSIFETRQTEFGIQDSAQPRGSATYGNGVAGPVGSGDTWLRITRHAVDGQDAYTASTSVDGRHWRTGGTWTTDLGATPRIGLVSMGGAGFTTVVDSVRVTALR